MQFGAYHIVKKIAVGGMAEIYLAHHLSTEGFRRQVVIKRILPEFATNPSFVESFLDEARLAGQLTHPNVAQIYDLGKMGNTYYIAMEYIQGVDLVALLSRARKTNEPLPLAVSMRIFCDMCAGLDYAHGASDIDGKALGVVHRDVTPSNVLVSTVGPAKLVDFGIAKATARGDGKTKTGTIKGKFAYLSPEQINGKAIDRRVDVFAAGIVLFELLTSKNPFRRDAEYTTLMAIVSEATPKPSLLRPEAAAFDAVIERALSKSPDTRYQTAGDLLRAVEAASLAAGVVPSHSAVQTFLQTHKEELERVVSGATDMAGVVFDAGSGEITQGELPPPVTGEQTALENAQLFEPPSEQATRVREPIAPPVLQPPVVAVKPRKPRFLVVALAASILAIGVLVAIVVQPTKTVAPPPPPAVVEVKPTPPPVVEVKPTPTPTPTPPPIAKPEPEKPEKPGKKGKHGKKTDEAKPHTIETTPAKPEPAIAAGPARLKIKVKPWGKVTLDGKALGETPLPTLDTTSGTHELVIENPELNKRVVRKIKLDPNKDNAVTIDLED